MLQIILLVAVASAITVQVGDITLSPESVTDISMGASIDGALIIGMDEHVTVKPTKCGGGFSFVYPAGACVNDGGDHHTSGFYTCASGKPTMVTFPEHNCTGNPTPNPLPWPANSCTWTSSDGHYNEIIVTCSQ